MIEFDEAWQRIAAHAVPLATQPCSLDDAIGRVLQGDVTATVDLPPFDNSAMDGYALRAADTETSHHDAPVRLRLGATIAAGSPAVSAVESGTAMQIMTGAPLPDGADSVLQLEHARRRDGYVEVREPLAHGRHVRRAGEDVRRGDTIARAGDVMNAQRAALLASAGIPTVDVPRRAHVGVLVTGSELVRPGIDAALPAGAIFDANGLSLRLMARDAGCDVVDLGIVADDPDSIRERISAASNCDVLLLSGGVSVGRYDHVKSVLADLGMQRLFWRVRMKPGKPLLCGRLGDMWVFGLPGNPISCVSGFAAFVAPLVRVLHGAQPEGPTFERAQLDRSMTADPSRLLLATAFARREDDGALTVTPTKRQGSAMMHSLAESNCFIVVRSDAGVLEPGAVVDVLRIR